MLSLAGWLAAATGAWADREVYLVDVPDYNWHAGCFGTATGNLMGFWDRNGLPDCYTGPTGGGLAPLWWGGNESIRGMWASEAGVDGRPAGQFGHMNDYHVGYESAVEDPHVTAGRAEHEPDCIGDFIGLNQKKWTNMNGECDGNIDGYSFVYWDPTGARRTNFVPPPAAGLPPRDIPSGLRAWTRHRGYDADVFSQLTDFNTHPAKVPGSGFTFEDLKAEIDAGYPVLLYLQSFTQMSQPRGSMPQGNPPIHGMMAYGYSEYPDFGTRYVYYRTSWASGDGIWSSWDGGGWQAFLPVRGVIGYHPKPRLGAIKKKGTTLTLIWEGPSARLYDALAGTTTPVHRYRVERAGTLTAPVWTTLVAATTEQSAVFTESSAGNVFYRVRLLRSGE